MKNDCLFCAIVAGEIPGTKVYEDELCYAFRDINPQAPTHILVVPKEHIASVAEITDDNAALAGHCLAACAHLVKINKHQLVAYALVQRGVSKAHSHHSRADKHDFSF